MTPTKATSTTALLCLLFATGCPKATIAGPPRSNAAVYGVAVAVASGPRVVTSLYDLEVSHSHGDVWTFVTTHSEGSWEESGSAILYDSDNPRDTDPWPLVYQHAISMMPTPVVMVDGYPTGIENPAEWKLSGLEAIRRVERLPPQALPTGEAMLDPDGVIRDLQRDFPGSPPGSAWVRSVTVAAVPATLIEACEIAEAAGGITTWTCAGQVEGPTEGSARLYEVTSDTTLTTDRHGLVEFDTRWAGTLVMLAPDGTEGVIDRPIAGHRVVQRRIPPIPES